MFDNGLVMTRLRGNSRNFNWATRSPVFACTHFDLHLNAATIVRQPLIAIIDPKGERAYTVQPHDISKGTIRVLDCES